MELIAEKREKLGKASKSLRAIGKVPASIFGKGMDTVAITLENMAVKKAFESAGETTLIDVKVGKDSYKTLFKEVQYDPVKGNIIHANFYKPDLTIRTEAQVPVEIINSDENPLVKSTAAVILALVNEITVSALPADLPHKFEIDASKLTEVGQSVTIADLDFDREKVEIVDMELTDVVVRIDAIDTTAEVEEAVVDESAAIEGLTASSEKVKDDEDAEAETKDKK